MAQTPPQTADSAPPPQEVDGSRQTTNRLLDRIANVLELIAEKHLGIDVYATTVGMSEQELERIDDLPPVLQEALAAIELLEEDGYRVGPEAYRRLGLPTPERYEPPTEKDFDAPQPGAAPEIEEPLEPADPDEPPTARRKDF